MRHRSRGFTLVELNLAVIAVALLVIAVAMVTINVTKINQHGILLKTINQTGREVMDMLERDLTVARSDKIKYELAGSAGRLCLGTVSYVFNTAEALSGGAGDLIRDETNTPVTLVRIDDKEGTWCQKDAGDVFIKTAITGADGEVTEVLQTDTVPVAVYVLEVNNLANSAETGQGIQELRLLLGTNEPDTVDASNVCKPPTDHEANFDECVVREFRTIVRSNGMTKGGS